MSHCCRLGDGGGGVIAIEIIRGVQSLLAPASCAGCRRALPEWGKSPLCTDCRRDLPLVPIALCQRCGVSLKKKRFFDQAVSPCRYEGAARELLAALKYRGQLHLIPFLADLLEEAVRQRLGPKPADAVVPVPLFPVRLRERSFNQARGLAQELAKRLHLPCRSDLLVRRNPTLPQAPLSRSERLRNVQGAFTAGPELPENGRRILLVDDVFTTGATAQACAKALKKAGASQVVVVTVANG